MTATRVFIVILATYLIAFFAHTWLLQKTVYGDGTFYYSWLRSLVIDHDLNFSNEYAHFGVTQPITPKGLLGNKYSIGPALVWAPAFVAIHTVVRSDGFGLPYQVGVGLTSLFAGIVGLVILFHLLPFGNRTKLLTVIALAFATNLFFYGALDTVNSHALSFAAACIFLAVSLVKKPSWGLVGVALAILALVRLQDIVYVLLLVPRHQRVRWMPLLIGFSITFIPQLIAWHLLYGSIANPYLTGGEGFSFPPHILSVLFSPQSGLFLWTPIAAVGVAGWFIPKKIMWGYVFVFLAELIVVSSWSTWWQGASFSGRMFVSTLPIVALGLGTFWSKTTKAPRLAVLLCLLALIFINWSAIVYFLLTLPA